jgi:hypothetical protein
MPMSVLEITTYGRNTLRRLRREARLVDVEAVPHLAPAYEIDPCAATTVVTEYLPDLTIDDLVGISPLPAAAALHALRDVARTLQAMHECGIVHGDLRPASVFILPDGRAALARPESPPPGQGTSAGDARGTDTYGFAVLAVELLTAVHPLHPDNPSSMAGLLFSLPSDAAIELGWALTAENERRPLPLDLVAALDAIPPEEWSTNHLRHEPVRLAPPLAEPVEAPSLAEPVEAPSLAEPVEAPSLAEPVEAPSLAEPVEASRQARHTIVPPKPRRSLFRRLLGPFVILVGLLTVVAGGGAGAWMLFVPDASAGDTAAAPVEVRRIGVTVTPPQALCPRASLHLAATIATDGGGGRIEVRWQLPDGSAAGTESLSVDEGRQVLMAAFDLRVSGTRPLIGEVTAIVSPGGARASAPIRYLCPQHAKTPRQARRA